MASSKTAWGMEIGANAIKAIRLERDGQEAKVTDFAVIPHKKVLSTPELDQDEMVRLALGQFISQKTLEGERLIVSVPGHAAFARFAKLPPVEPKKVPDIVRFEAVQQIPFPIEEVEWDYQTFTSTDSPEVEVGIFAITRERLLQRLGLYAELGIQPEVVTLSPVAVFNALNHDLQLGGRKTPTVIVDIGTNATDIIVAHEGRCWVRTFPLGGTHFTDAVASAFKLSYSKADKLKQEAASSKYAKQIMQAMRPVFSDLLQEVQRSIGYYQSLHRDAQLDTVIGVGSTFRIPGLRKFLGQQLQVEVMRLDEFRRIAVEGRDAADFAAHTVNLATAYGLALQGVGLAPIAVNLAPVDSLREQLWRSKTRWFAAAAGVAIAASAMLFIQPYLTASSMSPGGVPPQVEQVINRGNAIKREFQSLEGTAAVGATAENMRGLLTDRDIWSFIASDAAAAVRSANPQEALLGDDPAAMREIPAAARRLVELRGVRGTYNNYASERRRIEVVLDVDFTHASRGDFLNESVAAWLRANAVRPDVPYRILADTVRIDTARLATLTVGEDGTLDADAAGSTLAGGTTPRGGTTGSAGAPRTPSQPPTGGLGGGGGVAPGGAGAMDGRRRTGEQIEAPGGGRDLLGGGGGGGAPRDGGLGGVPGPDGRRSGGSLLGDGGTQEAPAEARPPRLAEDAPIPSRPSIHSAGDRVFRTTVTFTIEIQPKATSGGVDAAGGQQF